MPRLCNRIKITLSDLFIAGGLAAWERVRPWEPRRIRRLRVQLAKADALFAREELLSAEELARRMATLSKGFSAVLPANLGNDTPGDQ